jgi:transcriptional regulator with XRE-family HTH domain
VTFSRARLRGHRDGRRLSQTALAAAAGLEPGVLADIEAGRVEPGEPTVRSLADALRVARSALVPTRGDWAEDYIEVVVSYLPDGPFSPDGTASRCAASHPRRSASGLSRSGSL